MTVSGRLAFVSGQVAVDPGGKLVGEGDMSAQVTQALRNLEGVLRALGRASSAGSAQPDQLSGSDSTP